MDSFLLPATTYQPPLRQARTRKLNTIMENELGGREVEDDDEYNRGRKLNPTNRTADGSCSPVPSLTSSISSYYRTRPRSREFDPLYDVSDNESDQEQTPNYSKANIRPISTRDSWSSTGSRNRYPSLVIPSPTEWPTIQDFKNKSMVPPTPPPKIPISPAVLSLLTPHAPRASAPPSLDGSLSSDQIANSTAPPTPDLHCAPVQSTWGQFHVISEYSDYNEDLSLPNDGPTIEIQSDDGTQWEHTLSEVESVDDTSAPGSVVERPESPVLGDDTYVDEEDAGVRLPAGALDTLKHLSLELASEPSSAVVRSGSMEMQEIAPKWTRSVVDETPMSETSAYSFSELSIPSPGGFFSSLGANARHTWCAFNSEPSSAIPPSSTTAEHFYNAPWNTDPKQTVEQIVEVDDNMTDGPPTAFKRPLSGSSQKDYFGIPRASLDAGNAVQEIEKNKPVKEFDEDYEKEIWQSAETTFDRTSVWLAEQTSYMAALRETNPTNRIDNNNSKPTLQHAGQHIRNDSLDSPLKKAVKFLDTEVAKLADSRTTDSSKSDPIFYQAFQVMSNASSPTDSFIHRQTRYDAIQAGRASLPKEHVNQLLGNFYTSTASRPAPQRPISMMPGKEDADEETAEQRAIAQLERERQALEQVTTSMWIVEAAKYLCGGQLLNSPAAGVLSQAPISSTTSEHIRVLDLGGQPKCDWAWHCAREYPNVKTYTATSDLQAASHNLRGPSNHRLVTVPRLWQLPFPDNHFDAISARSLFVFLRNEKPLGETVDEYDMCLRECLRCLKPGGYLEFFVLDAEIVHPGPCGTALSVEFGFNLKARGYDAAPTKGWLGRVRRAGLTDIKRAWMFLPMGAVTQKEQTTPETPAPHVSIYEEQILQAEAVHGPVGSKADAAHISGLVGGWAWERWLLKLQVEMGKERVLEGVAAAFEEGKSTGAGWRCLSGWAKKPC